MAKKQSAHENIEWIVTGRAEYVGAYCIVHAKTRAEAMAKAERGEELGEFELEGASLANFKSARAEPNVCDE